VLDRAFLDRPTDEIDPCSFYCQQSYDQGNYPVECGYRRQRDEKTGAYRYADTPTSVNCLTADQKLGFELEKDTSCTVWNRTFTRPQLLKMLAPFVQGTDLRTLTKKQLCSLLSDKATEVYYELEDIANEWCNVSTGAGTKDSSAMAEPEIQQIFAILHLPPPATYFSRAEACVVLKERIAQMKPPLYSRVWRKIKHIFTWMKNNKTKTMLIAATLIAAIYFAPTAIQSISANYNTAAQQLSDVYASLDWQTVGRWMMELQRIKAIPPNQLTPTDIAHKNVLETKIKHATKSSQQPSTTAFSTLVPGEKSGWHAAASSTFEYLRNRA
jgi:hypothetical protein